MKKQLHNSTTFRSVVVLTLLGLLSVVAGFQPALCDIDPETLTATLMPGESVDETKTVTLPEVIPKGDVVFGFDLTGSMGGAIDIAKTEAVNIMNSLDALIADSKYAVTSYMDYPGTYSACDYNRLYGDAAYGDYAYNLDQVLTADRTAVATAINSLVLGYGGDGPQDYERIMYESYADPAIVYRAEAKKILINFGDNVPHDCDLNEGVPGTSGTWTTGSDPGRDEIMGNGDDLDLHDVLAGMAANEIALLEVHTTSSYSDYWDHWTALTGGEHYVLTSVTDIPQAIYDLILAQAVNISNLTLVVTTPGFEPWLTSVNPPAYTDLTLPTGPLDFDIIITVPMGTPAGTYEFYISAIGDGASYGDQLVTITVIETEVVAFDIKPTSCPNPLNTKGHKDTFAKISDDTPWTDILDNSKGPVLPVAILGTADIDVRDIDPASLTLLGEPPVRWAYEDVAAPVGEDAEPCECTTAGPDGFEDLTVKFDKTAIVAALGVTYDGQVIPLTINGEMFDGVPIEGMDCVVIRGKKGGELASAGDPGPLTSLLRASPNPFNPITTMSFYLAGPCEYSVTIYNIAGQTVRNFEGIGRTGLNEVIWDASDNASGIYFYRLTTDGFADTKKMLLLK